jgi:hypothetical protein
MLTRGVWRATPSTRLIGSAAVTTPRAASPCPPSFSLANRKISSPAAIALPPYIVFCASKRNVAAGGSGMCALIANTIIVRSPLLDEQHPRCLLIRNPALDIERGQDVSFPSP